MFYNEYEHRVPIASGELDLPGCKTECVFEGSNHPPMAANHQPLSQKLVMIQDLNLEIPMQIAPLPLVCCNQIDVEKGCRITALRNHGWAMEDVSAQAHVAPNEVGLCESA
jgi:hypothetical protein